MRRFSRAKQSSGHKQPWTATFFRRVENLYPHLLVFDLPYLLCVLPCCLLDLLFPVISFVFGVLYSFLKFAIEVLK